MLKDWIQLARDKGASDLHLEGGTPLVLRIRGELVPLGGNLSPDALIQSAKEILGNGWQEFLNRRSADLSQTIAGTRCRINAYQTVRGVGFAIRLLYSFHNTVSDCNLHPDLRRFVKPATGLLLISGPTGSGKSTTLAALIEEINSTERRQILTIESPIEYFFTNRQSFIRQREVLTHTPSYEQALTDAMREDPDVLVISEMRTPDVMRLTLNAAETGHLVLATMHSSTCAEAISRICMSFAPEIQGSIRAQLADCLVGVVCQRLLYLPQNQLRVPHCEVMVANSAIRATIRGGQMSQLASAIQTGGEDGMWSFDRYQRWIEQKRDWVRPKSIAPADEREEVSSRMSDELRRPVQSTPRTVAGSRPAPSRSILAGPPRAPNTPSTGHGRIEISTEEEDLEELARLISEKEKSGDSD